MSVSVSPRLVVDTDVVSFLFKDDTRARLYESHFDDRVQGLTVISESEHGRREGDA